MSESPEKPYTVNVHHAKTQFSKLLARVEKGAEIIIARAGTPVAKIVPLETCRDRVGGQYAGEIWVADDFDAPLTGDELALFEE